jgi:hypothetical protein
MGERFRVRASYPKLRLARASTLRAAIEVVGIRLAPSITTWTWQSQYLVDGNEASLKAYQDALTAGRED